MADAIINDGINNTDLEAIKQYMKQITAITPLLEKLDRVERNILESAVERGKFTKEELKLLKERNSLEETRNIFLKIQEEAIQRNAIRQEVHYENIKKLTLSQQQLELEGLKKQAQAEIARYEEEVQIFERLKAKKQELSDVEQSQLQDALASLQDQIDLYNKYSDDKTAVDAKLAARQEAFAKKLDNLETKNFTKRQKQAHELNQQIEKNKQAESEKLKEINEAIDKGDNTEQLEEELKLLKEQTAELEKQQETEERSLKYRKAAFSTAVSSANELTGLMSKYGEYMVAIDTRLQGSGRSASSIRSLVGSAVGATGFVSQQQLMQKITEAVNSGIEYNVEQRAFLATISDKIANTFEAFDSNLIRLIRIQQADSTAARLGMESILTQFLNSQFEDTGYLDRLSKTVAGAVLDAESLMSRDAAMEFEYTIQKWFGALYSLGLSEGTITQMAQGLNYLGTGNVSALAGSGGLSVLMPMIASRAGIPYGETLIGGLTAETTNKLLSSMVEYLKEISDDTNNVVKSAYGDIFNLSISDIQAIRNLNSGDISNIISNSLTYQQALGETGRQLRTGVSSRMPISQVTSNLFENVQWMTATSIADNPALYSMWLLNDFIERVSGGINLPSIGVFGNFVDLNANLNQLIKLGMVGLGLIGQAGNIISGVGATFGGSAPGLAGFNASEYTSRGQGLNILDTGYGSGISMSGYVGSSATGDIFKQTVTEATGSAQEVGEITNAGTAGDHTFEDFWQAVFVEKMPITVTTPPNQRSIDDIYAGLERLYDLMDEVITAGYVKTYDQTDYNASTALGRLASNPLIGGV